MEAQQTEYCWDGLSEHIPMLRKELKRRVGNPVEVEDLIQETLLRAARFRHKLRAEACLRGWLRQIARRVLSEHYRRESRRPCEQASLEFFEIMPGREHEPGTRALSEGIVICGQPVFRHQLIEEVDSALGQMRPQDRVLIARRYGVECVAEGGSPHKTSTKDHMFRARQRLRRRLRPRLPRLLRASSGETFVEENR